jgi:hypothetical protein
MMIKIRDALHRRQPEVGMPLAGGVAGGVLFTCVSGQSWSAMV